MKKSILITVSGIISPEHQTKIAQGDRPRADYLELARVCQADLLDYKSARVVLGPLSALIERVAGRNLVLALACWKLRKRYQAILTDGEQVGLPLALLFKFPFGKRPAHLMITHILSVGKKAALLSLFRLEKQIDRFIVYSSWQKQFIQERWHIPCKRVLWTPFMVDQVFFHPQEDLPVKRQICSVGLERRDYPTLLEAVDGLDVDVVIAAASPWSKRSDSTAKRTIPANVQLKRFTFDELRTLYAESAFMVLPLELVNFQAGITSLLEAFAMGKAVICSRIPGQTDVINEGEHGYYVPPQDPKALREAILRLLDDPESQARMGHNGRHLIEREMNIDAYAHRLRGFIYDLLDEKKP
jgi:glycosyltransferase involved in cell wall biosynthesis